MTVVVVGALSDGRVRVLNGPAQALDEVFAKELALQVAGRHALSEGHGALVCVALDGDVCHCSLLEIFFMEISADHAPPGRGRTLRSRHLPHRGWSSPLAPGIQSPQEGQGQPRCGSAAASARVWANRCTVAWPTDLWRQSQQRQTGNEVAWARCGPRITNDAYRDGGSSSASREIGAFAGS